MDKNTRSKILDLRDELVDNGYRAPLQAKVYLVQRAVDFQKSVEAPPNAKEVMDAFFSWLTRIEHEERQ